MATVTIEVTQEDINAGRRADCRACPIARATKRKVPACHVEVGRYYVVLMTSRVGDSYDFRLPDFARRFVEDFDFGIPVEPFAFDLIVHDELISTN